MLIDITPLKKYKNFRYLFLAQAISTIGTMISYVVVPYQVYQLTKSNFLVGCISLVQLVSVIIFGILGGAYADRMDRKKVMVACECIMTVIMAAFAFNASLEHPSLCALFILVGLLQAVSGFHRPSMTALLQKMIEPDDFKAVSSLTSLIGSVGAILGPALGGILIANMGFAKAYTCGYDQLFNIALFSLSKFLILRWKPMLKSHMCLQISAKAFVLC